MAQQVELSGRPASPGLASGPLLRLEAEPVGRIATGDPLRERAALERAVAAAIGEIESLMQQSGPEGAAILEFQAAMLADDELIAPALREIAAGAGAEVAWRRALAAQLSDYEAAADDYFRARAADLADLRDRVLRNLAGQASGVSGAGPIRVGAILVGEDIAPSRFLETDWTAGGGVALSGGSAASHVAMLARSRGVPMAVGLGPLPIEGHAEALLDGTAGTLILSPDEGARASFQVHATARASQASLAAAHLNVPARTADGTPIRVLVNIARPDELDRIDPAACDGIGLMRTEFLFGGGLPDEAAQYRAYTMALAWARGRPVTIRTLDAGGDKPIAGLTIAETNPFLGLRGIRLSLARPDHFRVQLRALARAAALGDLKVMLPMVTVPGEIAAASALLDEAVAELRAEGAPHARPPLGIMLETPAAAIAPDLFDDAAFFSIGSNDLTQYVTAAARDSEAVAGLNDIRHPAVRRLIAGVVAHADRAGIEVSLCGDAGGDPAELPWLLQTGLRTFSVAPAALALVKASIAGLSIGGDV